MKRVTGLVLIVSAALFLPSLLDYSLLAAIQDNPGKARTDDGPVRDIGYRSPGERHKLVVRDRTLSQDIGNKGGRLVSDYGNFQVMEVDSSIADDMSSNDQVEVRDDYNLIMLNVAEIDTTVQELEQTKETTEPAASQRKLHLVQFAGPIRPEWYERLTGTGVNVVSYVPNNAYLIYGDRRSLRRVRAMTEQKTVVQWDGDYKSEFKVDPSSFARNEKGLLTLQSKEGLYGIQLTEDKEQNAATLRLIDEVKLEPVQVQWKVLSFVNLVVSLSDEGLQAISKQPDVISIAPYVMPTKLDERQNQIVAGNLTGTEPTPGDWLAYLSAHGFTQAQFTASGFAVNVSDSGIDNATVSPNHFALYEGGLTTNPSRVLYNRLEGTAHVGSTLEGCDGHGNLNSHIVGGFIPFGFGSGFPHADAAGFRYGMGVCPFVKLGSSVIFDPNIFTNPNLVNLESQAYNNGSRISNNSWGANVGGAYNLNSQTFDAIVRDAQPTGSPFAAAGNQEYVVVFSAGNAGPGLQTVGAPGTAKNVITVGASENVHSHSTANGGNNAAGNDGCATPDTGADNANDLIGFSSRGPCTDQRKKPDIVAPGTHVTGGVGQVALPPVNGQANACFSAGGVCALPGSGVVGDPDNFFPVGQQFYTTSSGTSHSTPAVAGAAALARQHFINEGRPAPSPAMTKAALMNSARYLTGAGANDTLWSNSQGIGEVNLNSFFDIFDTPSVIREQSAADTFSASGQMRVITGNVSDPSKPFRITLGWTDAPGPTIGNAFVNNLDLEVTVGGNTFKGNVFTGAFSSPGGLADPRNNVESVFLPAGVTGTFIITVRATNIAGDGVPNFGGLLDQDFALVVFNAAEAAVPVVVSDNATVTAESCSPANGVIDPNETVTVDFALKNIGTGNTGNLIATLMPTGGVTGPSGPQSYGVVIAGGPAVSRPFTFTANAACGSTLTATLQLQDGPTDLGTATFTFTIGTLNPLSIAANYSSGGLAVPIPDLGTVESPITIPDTGAITDVNVRLRIDHTFDGDLDIFLVAPDGTTVELSTDNGAAGDNYGAGAADCTGVFTVFDDSAATSITAGTAPFAGSFRPEQPLSALNGKNVNGTWKLRISDDANLDVGTLGCWELEINRRVFICCGVPGTPIVFPAGFALTAESCNPPNGAPDPDETVTVSFALTNAGSGDPTNLVATLLATGGITLPSAPATYGVIPAGGPAVSRSFTFVPTGACGSTVIATLELKDGVTDLGTVGFPLVLGSTAVGSGTASNPASITIPAVGTSGPAAPYPSTIAVSGLSGTITKVRATLTNMNHTFPGDVDILLVGPAGQTLILMSDAGGGVDLVNTTLTFDDAAASALPDTTAIVSGTFRPTNIGGGDIFPAPAPATAPGAALSVFNGANPNGTWMLFVNDDVGGDVGNIAGGWSLDIATAVPVCCDSPCILTCPANITQPNDPGVCTAVVNFTGPSVSGTCAVITCSPPSGSTFPVGTTTVTCNATNTGGTIVSTCTFTVKVVEPLNPTITCPENILLRTPNPGQSTVVVNYAPPVASDNCGVPTVVCNPPSGSVFSVGTTTVTCTATDLSGNQAACSFTVKVFDFVIKNDATSTFLILNSVTGEYEFSDCSKGLRITGRGVVTKTSCKIELRDSGPDPKVPDRSVLITINPCTRVATGTFRTLSPDVTHAMNDSNIANNPLPCK